jgi:hypothetical protein
MVDYRAHFGHGFNGDYALDGKVRLVIDRQIIRGRPASLNAVSDA